MEEENCTICNIPLDNLNAYFEGAWGMGFCNDCLYKIWDFIDGLKAKNRPHNKSLEQTGQSNDPKQNLFLKQ